MFYRSSTGRPLTKPELDRLRAIVEKHLREVEKVVEPASVISTMAEERLAAMQANKVPLEQFLAAGIPRTLAAAITAYGVTPNVAQAMQYAQANTGIYLQSFTRQLQESVVRTVNNALRANLPPEDTARQLWKQFGEFNRDWRMIAVTEAASNANNGFLLGRKVGSYVVGISRNDACSWCLTHMHGRILKVVDPPRPGEPRDWDNEIWVGKSNYGRYQHLHEQVSGRTRFDHELWKPAAIAHPNCRCRWLPINPKFQEFRNGRITVKARAGKDTP